MDSIHQWQQIFILLVDDYTRMMWVYFLKQNYEAFNSFIRFKALVGNQSKSKIKTLRTDHDREYIYQSFLNYYIEKGIRRKLTKMYSPQKNGVADRKNRIIVEMARRMLKGKGLSIFSG